MRFRAKSLSQDMRVESLEMEAGSEAEARHWVEAAGGRVLHLEALGTSWRDRFKRNTFNLAVFNQQLHTLLEAGQPIVDAIEVLGRNDRRDGHRFVYDALLSSLQQGKQLSQAMSSLPSVFPPLYVAMVQASETTGTVRASIRRFMHYQQQAELIRSKLVAAAIYPAILVAVGFVVIGFLMLYVVPRFSAVFDEVAASKRSAAGLVQIWGTFVRDNGAVAWSGFFLSIFGAIAMALSPRVIEFVQRKILTVPWVGEKVWVLQLARMYRTLGMLLRSGVSVVQAMKMTGTSLPANMRAQIDAATRAVSEGRSMSSVMAEYGLGTEVSQRLLLAGESSGNLDEMMEKSADFFDQETAAWIDTAGRLIEPILMVGIGLVIGGIVLMLYSPIFDLANAV